MIRCRLLVAAALAVAAQGVAITSRCDAEEPDEQERRMVCPPLRRPPFPPCTRCLLFGANLLPALIRGKLTMPNQHHIRRMGRA